MSNENPFKCKHPKCGRSFTKEDHLAQHMTKHELGLNMQFLNEPEQTPTPTRGLQLGDISDNLCLPLTSDLVVAEGGVSTHGSLEDSNDMTQKAQVKATPQNPFDRAFRAATFELRRSHSNASVDSNKTIPVINNLAPQDILRTPQGSVTSIGNDSLGISAGLMHLNPNSTELSLAGIVPLSPLPSASVMSQKPSLLTKTSTISSFLASLGLASGQEELTDGINTQTLSADILSKACSSGSAVAGTSSGITIQDQNGQPQVLLLHTPQPQPQKQSPQVIGNSDQSLTMLPLSVNAGTILQSPTASVPSNGPLPAAQLYVPYLLQENGTMIPLGRLATGGVLNTDLAETVVNKRISISGSEDSVHNINVDGNPTVEEEAVTSSTLSLTDGGSRNASEVSTEKGGTTSLSDNKDKIKEAIRRRCATSAADSLSCAPPRKRLSHGALEVETNDNNEGNSNRSSTSGSSTGGTSTSYSPHVIGGVPIRGRKALELAAKLESARDDDGNRDQLEKKLLYLERNRAASQRSRDKKKKIMSELRDKNRHTDHRNKVLEQANLRLREEVVYLKSLLLQHIDCPKLPFQIKSGCDFKSDSVSSLILNGERSQVDVAGSTEFILRPTTVGESAVSLQHPSPDVKRDQSM